MKKIEIFNNDKDYYDAYNLFKLCGINNDVLKFVVPNLLPRDEKGNLLVNLDIIENKNGSISYVPSTNTITLSSYHINEWLNNNLDFLCTKINTNDSKRVRNYLVLFMISHEIEHSYQYLMAEDMIECKSNNLKFCYKVLYDFITGYKKFSIIKRKYNESRFATYDNNHDNFILERNANIEACDKIMKLALINREVDIYAEFNLLRLKFMQIGYDGLYNGSLEETLMSMRLYELYERLSVVEELDTIDKIRFGLPVDDESKKLLFYKKF